MVYFLNLKVSHFHGQCYPSVICEVVGEVRIFA